MKRQSTESISKCFTKKLNKLATRENKLTKLFAGKLAKLSTNEFNLSKEEDKVAEDLQKAARKATIRAKKHTLEGQIAEMESERILQSIK